MGMAPYGKPKYLDKVKKLIKIYADGSFRLNMDYFTFQKSADYSFSRKFVELFGEPRPHDLHFFTATSGYPSYFGAKPQNFDELCRLNQRYADIAASIQALTEEVILKLAQTVWQKTKLE